MRKSLLLFSIVVLPLVFTGCGPAREQEEAALRVQQVADSIAHVESLVQKHNDDSAHRADSIRALPCPALAEYIRLNERTIAMLKTASGDEDLERINKTMDSITACEKKLTAHLDDLEPHCRRRYLALSLIYTRDVTNGTLALMGAAGQLVHSRNDADDHTDSLAKAIEFGE